MTVTITQQYDFPRTRQSITQQSNLILNAANQIDTGESEMLGLGPIVVSTVTQVGSVLRVILQFDGNATFETQFKTPKAKQTAVNNLWTARFSQLCKQSGVTCSTAIT